METADRNSNSNRMTAGQFAAIRAELGLTQMELAGLLRRGRSTVDAYETGRRSVPPEVALQLVALAEVRHHASDGERNP